MRKKFLGSIFIISLISIFALVSEAKIKLFKESPKKSDELYQQLELFAETISLVRANYVEEVGIKDLIYGALKGMLSSLDPHSQFMDPDTYNEIKVETEGEFGGLGIVISIKDELLTIISPIDGTPAERAGLKAGDRIVKIDGVSTKGITLMEAVKKLRGTPGTKVNLTILREEERKLLEFTLERAIIKIESVKEAKIIEDKIGYIRIIEFQEKTGNDLEKALDKLEAEGMEGLIIDLRNNPGGLLDAAVAVAEKFIAPGKVVVSTKGRVMSQNLEFPARAKKPRLDYPLVVLINEGSASASEIVAGCLHDHNRAILLGTKTFGKGSVQTVIPLKDGSAVRLTTSKYFTPAGNPIHGVGINPDIEIPFEEESTVKEKKEALKPEQIFEEIEEKEELSLEKTKPVYDNQIQRAIDLLKGLRVYSRWMQK
ncbi:MAG: S41 family peptidase [Candidatus Omnitrophica bacterium]|nr:S41 family peptidase [Candidatus Omnitrophota bacterium]MCM8793688.1 S41 family peptidase [Candidatus Omnitrophota bacterium]